MLTTLEVVEVYVEVVAFGVGSIVHDYVVEEGRVIGEMLNIAEAIETVDVGVLDFLHIDLVFFWDVAFLHYEGVETFVDLGYYFGYCSFSILVILVVPFGHVCKMDISEINPAEFVFASTSTEICVSVCLRDMDISF